MKKSSEQELITLGREYTTAIERYFLGMYGLINQTQDLGVLDEIEEQTNLQQERVTNDSRNIREVLPSLDLTKCDEGKKIILMGIRAFERDDYVSDLIKIAIRNRRERLQNPFSTKYSNQEQELEKIKMEMDRRLFGGRLIN